MNRSTDLRFVLLLVASATAWQTAGPSLTTQHGLRAVHIADQRLRECVQTRNLDLRSKHVGLRRCSARVSSVRCADDIAVAGYASGQLPLVSVIEAVQALWLVQSDLIAADTELGLAWARLGRAIGSYEAMIQ